MSEFMKSLAILIIPALLGIVMHPKKSICCLDVMTGVDLWPPFYMNPALMNDKLPAEDGYVFSTHHFEEIVALHNELRPQFTEARALLASHVEELVQLVKSLPGTEFLSESSIRNPILSWKETLNAVSGASVFEPWTNRWKGVWSNGKPQFHIWDETRRWNGQWIQAVAQSEYAFPEETRLPHLLQQNKTDLGINVYSKEYGVTGWVSKRQHGPLEIPCIGYVIDEPILLWVCAVGYQNRLISGEWFVYLERVERIEDTHHYVINGHPFTFDDGLVWTPNAIGTHAGRYSAEEKPKVRE